MSQKRCTLLADADCFTLLVRRVEAEVGTATAMAARTQYRRAGSITGRQKGKTIQDTSNNMRNIIRKEEEIQGGELRRVFPRLLKQTVMQRIKSKLLKLKQLLL